MPETGEIAKNFGSNFALLYDRKMNLFPWLPKTLVVIITGYLNEIFALFLQSNQKVTFSVIDLLILYFKLLDEQFFVQNGKINFRFN